MSARELGADIRVRTRLAARAARERPVARDAGRRRRARASEVARARWSTPPAPGSRTMLRPASARTRFARDVRHVKGSHIVVPRVHAEPHAYILQNSDKRIVFMIPFERALFADRHDRRAGRRLRRRRASRPRRSITCARSPTPISRARSPRPTSSGPTAACGRSTTTARRTRRRSRATTCSSSMPATARAPLLSVFGGKITTYRKLAEHALGQAAPFFPADAGRLDRSRSRCPAATCRPAGSRLYERALAARYPGLPADARGAGSPPWHARAARPGRCPRAGRPRRAFRAHALRAPRSTISSRRNGRIEADDVLWRRTKCGLHMSAAERARVAAYLRELPRGGPRERGARCGRSPRCRARCARRCAACWPTSTTRCRPRGRITAEAYAAMERLRAAGLLLIPITGRPAGWCDHIARMWPVDAVVGENGALYMRHDDGRAQAAQALRRDRGRARRQPRAARRDRRDDPARGARRRARLRPALSRKRSRDRLLRRRAAPAATRRSTASWR